MAVKYMVNPIFKAEEYGFPMEIPEERIGSKTDIYNFLVENGYPQEIIDNSYLTFHASVWSEEVTEVSSGSKKKSKT